MSFPDNIMSFDFCTLNPAGDSQCPYCTTTNGFDPSSTKELLLCMIAYTMTVSGKKYSLRNTGKSFALSVAKKSSKSRQYQIVLDGDDESFILRGDNLLTFNGVLSASPFDLTDPRIAGTVSGCKCGLTYDKPRAITTLSAYFLLPYSTEILPGRELYKRHSGIEISSRKGVISPYHDNPFEFFAALYEVYTAPHSKREMMKNDPGFTPKLKRDLAATWNYWGMFGIGEEGFYRFLDCFCLEYFDPKNNATARLRTNPSRWTPQDFKFYVAVIREIESKRGQDILKRCSNETLKRAMELASCI